MATRMKELFRKYGRTAVGVHLGVYATSLAGEAGVSPGNVKRRCGACAEGWLLSNSNACICDAHIAGHVDRTAFMRHIHARATSG